MIYEASAKSSLFGKQVHAQAVKRVGWVSAATAIALLPLAARAQTADPVAPPPLTAAQSERLNQKVAAAEASGTEPAAQIVSETFTGKVVGIADDRSIRIHRDDKNRDETISLYGVRTFGSGPTGGKDAQSYLTDHLKNAHVKVEGRNRDRNGTLSALVTDLPPASSTLVSQQIDGSGASRDFPQHADAPSVAVAPPTVNYALLRLGLARFDVRQLKDAPDLSGAEAAARKEKKGYWSDSTVAASAN